MAYSNFIPSVWEESINRELERACVFVEDCMTALAKRGRMTLDWFMGREANFSVKTFQVSMG